MELASLKAGVAAPFAHLFGRAPKVESKAKAEDEKKEKDEKAEDENPDGKKAEADDEKKDSEKDGEKSKSKSKAKAKAEGGDDEEEDEEEMKAAARAEGVQAERTRWVATLSNPAAGGKGEAALTLLTTTDLSSEQVVATLNALPAAKADGLSQRMSTTKVPNPGTGGSDKPADGPQAVVAAGVALYDRHIGRAQK